MMVDDRFWNKMTETNSIVHAEALKNYNKTKGR